MTIVITLPGFFDGEAEQIVRLLRSSVDLVHIRKPQATLHEVETLLGQIPCEYHSRLVLHDHHSLAATYHLYGVHLNSRNPLPPAGWSGSVSRSCHSLEEVVAWKDRCRYVSLSPVFDSISKQGYRAVFTASQLAQARAQGIIDHRVLALGGVTFSRLDEVLRMGFGGAMILGDAWKGSLQAVALTIAGSDSSAGAGIQQDLKTMTALGVYGATVITAVTSQNTTGVKAVLPMPAQTVASQLDAVLADLHITAVKIGMIPDSATAVAVARALSAYRRGHDCTVVYDPVMVSTSGRRLMDQACVETVKRVLFPLCTLVTPNMPETECLLGQKADNKEAGLLLARQYRTPFLIKGGHGNTARNEETNPVSVDWLCFPNGETARYESPMIDTPNLHGTGCTLSSAIASCLLKGEPLTEAVGHAKCFVTAAIARSKDMRIGRGNGPLKVKG